MEDELKELGYSLGTETHEFIVVRTLNRRSLREGVEQLEGILDCEYVGEVEQGILLFRKAKKE